MAATSSHLKADLALENDLWQAGYQRIAGVDEAGRGAWAGPVVAVAVILPADPAALAPLLGVVDDSKRLTPAARERLFDVIQARALGVGNLTIMFRHLLPNAMVATITFLPFLVTGAISTLAALDLLGFGLQSTHPSLGELALQGRNNIQAPWLGVTAFFTFAIMLSLLVFVFEAVRDAFDPRKTFS